MIVMAYEIMLSGCLAAASIVFAYFASIFFKNTKQTHKGERGEDIEKLDLFSMVFFGLFLFLSLTTIYTSFALMSVVAKTEGAPADVITLIENNLEMPMLVVIFVILLMLSGAALWWLVKLVEMIMTRRGKK